MKTLRYSRHSDKEGAIIGQPGLDRAQAEAPKGAYTDYFHGPVGRTCQTLLAVVAALGQPGKVHAPIQEVGTDELFKEMVTDAFKAAVQSGKTNMEALLATHSPEQVGKWAANALKGVRKMFDAMPDGGSGLCYGHDPIIPLACLALGIRSRSLESLEFADFMQNDGGNITADCPE